MRVAQKKLKIYKDFYDQKKRKYEENLYKVEQIAEDYSRLLFKEQAIKTLDLPCGGALRLRKKPESIEIENEIIALEWTEKNVPKAINKELRKTELKEYIKATGELPPGIKLNQPKATDLSFSMSL
jgi:hypothetical protein